MRNIIMLAFGVVLFIPQAHNGVRDWFTAQDVVNWSAEAGNVMPISCTGKGDVLTSCTVEQAQPLILVWDNALGKVIAK